MTRPATHILRRRLLSAVSAVTLLIGSGGQPVLARAAPAAPAAQPAPATPPATPEVLPVTPPIFAGALGRSVKTSAPARYAPPVQAPKGAPNVLIIMTDDVGFGASSTFGGPIPTPTYDALAAHGLRYNRFETTALCSPTRAALLTGRNHHSVGSGVITELATGYPGYTSIIPPSAATIGEVLKDNGYSTSWFGKNHNTPEWEITPTGPYERWPNGLGFDYFYGFMGGETNQWAPGLIENRNAIEPPHDDPDYHMDRDLADHAIGWLHTQHTMTPDKPFLLYLAPGTAHAPHDAPKAWIARFKGQFDMGWDKMREETFARQKAAGVIPADAVLTPRPPEIPAWDSLSADQQKVYAHMMEVYAAALAYCDSQIGRVIQSLRDSGQLDNTIILYVQGDNGGSAEGGLGGAVNDLNALNGIREDTAYQLANMDEMGGPHASDHYPVGWAWAMNTPFQWTKQIASHFGGTRNPLVVSWPSHIQASGQVRSQFASVIDIAPTLYEVIGITPPKVVNGVKQQPLEGVSLAYTFNAPNAPGRHNTQYFEMLGNRAIYKDGWMASTHPGRLPWIPTAGSLDPDSYKWELYNVDADFTQAHDLAASDPKRLEALRKEFDKEAVRYNVLPIDPRAFERSPEANRPNVMNGRSHFTYYTGQLRYAPGAWPDLRNRSWKVSAEVAVVRADTNGMIVTEGGRFAGWGLMMFAGRPTFIYKRSAMPGDVLRIDAQAALTPGSHVVQVVFDADPGPSLGLGAHVRLLVDGAVVGEGHVPHTTAFLMTAEGAAIGHDNGTPLIDDYALPFTFQGVIGKVDFDLEPRAGAAAAPRKAPD